jgi:hypothetical protein
MTSTTTTPVSRRIAYIESDGVLFRIRKGDAQSEWKSPTQIASVTLGDHIYFAFLPPMSVIMGEEFEPNVVYHCMATKTKERRV